ESERDRVAPSFSRASRNEEQGCRQRGQKGPGIQSEVSKVGQPELLLVRDTDHLGEQWIRHPGTVVGRVRPPQRRESQAEAEAPAKRATPELLRSATPAGQ